MKNNFRSMQFMLKKISVLFSLTVFVTLVLFPVYNSTGDIPVEVITSIPVETGLGSRGTRNAAKAWVELINGSSLKIDLAEFYMISKKGEPLEPVINALMNAADRGVKIRILTDKRMAGTYPEISEKLKTKKNISIRIFNWGKIGMGVLHAKFFIVDERLVYVGSQNFDWRSLKHIHETGVLVKEPGIVKNLMAIFEADWEYNGGNKKAYEFNGFKKVQMRKNLFLTASPGKFNPPGVKSTLEVIKEVLGKAKKKVTIQLLNYQTSRYKSLEKFTELGNILKNAGKRGVSVKLLVSDWNLRKHQVGAIKELVGVPGIEVKVVTIPLYSAGFIPFARVIHSKVMRVDEDLCMVSTSNWGYGYFYSSRNVEVFFRSEKNAKTLDLLFNDLWSSKYAFILDPEIEYKEPKIN